MNEIGKFAWLALGAGAYLAFLVATLPAGIAASWLAPDQVSVSSPTGTAWNGQAAAASVPGLTVTDVRWRLKPLGLLLLRASGDIEFRLADGFGSTEFSAGPGGNVDLTDVRFASGIPTLAGVLPVYDTRGQVSATLDRLEIADGWVNNAVGEVRVADLEVEPIVPTGTPGRIALGNYEAVLSSADGGIIVADLNDAGGPLEVQGELRLQPDRNYEFSGRLRPRDDAPQSLRQGIELMAGLPDAAGMREMTLSGSL